jgi:hypothetical protein
MKGFPHTQAYNVITTVEKLNFLNTLIVTIFQLYTDVFKTGLIPLKWEQTNFYGNYYKLITTLAVFVPYINK